MGPIMAENRPFSARRPAMEAYAIASGVATITSAAAAVRSGHRSVRHLYCGSHCSTRT